MTRRVVTAALGLFAVITSAEADEDNQKHTAPYTLGEIAVTGDVRDKATAETKSVVSDEQIAEKGART